ncbi:MAG: exo-beta-N-acetylmuramidase NamZ domain-containing protein [Bacteroidales bacterium]
MFRNLIVFVFFVFSQFSCSLAVEKDNSEDRHQSLTENSEIIPGAWRTEEYFPLLEGKAIGLVGNHSSLIGDVHLVDTLLASGFNLLRVFSPEHGFRGEVADGQKIESGVDPLTGISLISLYGANRRPDPEQLIDLDLIIFDIQDVGARFYTYISTMSYMMEEAARQDIPMLILDRPNPNGHFVDGPILEKEHSTFVGLHPVPIAHGMTVAEYAQMVNGQGWLDDGLKCELKIVPVKNYERQMWYELPVAPSPNLPNMTSIMLYPGLCLMEGTVLSVGRGTDFPFQVYGHPDLPSDEFSFTFTPRSRRESVYPPQEGNLCFGVDLRTIHPEKLMEISKVDLQPLLHAWKNFPDKENFFITSFERLAGTTQLRKQILEGKSEGEIRKSWQEGLRKFIEMRRPYLIYPDL